MVTVTKYVWDPVFDCVTSELDENNAVKAAYHNEPQQYGGVLSQRRGNTSHYHHHDALGSTRFLTDSSGNVTDTYLHDAWGNWIASSGTTVNPFRWVGKYGYYQDASTGLVYVRARVYQPTVARWCSVDPLGVSFDMALFVYASNNSVFYNDRSGKSPLINVAGDCSSTFCTSTGPHGFSEGNTLLQSRVTLGATCESSFLEMTLRENHSVFENGKFTECSRFANVELNHVFRENAKFELIHYHDPINDTVVRPNCSIQTEWRTDNNKCWDLSHTIKCPLICNTGLIPGSEPCEAPKNFALGVWKYGIGRKYPDGPYDLSTFLIAFDINLNLKSSCCKPEKCFSLNASFFWTKGSWNILTTTPIEVPPFERRLVPANNCTEKDLPTVAKVNRSGSA